MYGNIGGKIKNIIRFVVGIEIVGAIIGGLAIAGSLGEGGTVIGILIAGGGALMAWLSGMLIYAVGEMTEAVVEIRDMLKLRGTAAAMRKNYRTVPEEEQERAFKYAVSERKKNENTGKGRELQ